MTPEQHNKFLGYSHLGFVLIQTLFGVLMSAFMFVMSSTMPSSPPGKEPPPGFFILMMCFVLIFTVGWSVPSMIAAFALLKRRRWAKVAAIVAGVFAASQVPIGTAVCAYTFWFVFSEPGKALYDRPTQTLTPAASDRNRIDTARQEEQHSTPPASPPNWR
jgi:heme/copper-type cytochrome/quinol oxidase subunit 3